MGTGGTALVVFSGGQDSSTCLVWALERYARVETVAFDYGQRHRIELKQRLLVLEALRLMRPKWDQHLADDHLLDLSVLGAIGGTAMTEACAIALRDDGLPNTFVPGRNLLFLTVAAALAVRRGIDVLVGGMCETDYSGYPDCRHETLQSQQATLSLGMGQGFTIETPLMWLDKAATWALADSLGGAALVDVIVEHTHTCYLGERGQRQTWGYGCGACPACLLRANGWVQWRAKQGQSALP